MVSIGRLDLNTEGLLLLTNDGGLARALELPATGWLRRYRVRAHGKIAQAQLDALRHGIKVDGIRYGAIEATLDREQGANVWLTFAMREGKNREVRNVLGHLGLEVNRLIRVSYGPFQLGDLPDGAVEEIKTRALREQTRRAHRRRSPARIFPDRWWSGSRRRGASRRGGAKPSARRSARARAGDASPRRVRPPRRAGHRQWPSPRTSMLAAASRAQADAAESATAAERPRDGDGSRRPRAAAPIKAGGPLMRIVGGRLARAHAARRPNRRRSGRPPTGCASRCSTS